MDSVQYSTFTFNTRLPILLSRCAVLAPNSVFCWFNVLSSFQSGVWSYSLFTSDPCDIAPARYNFFLLWSLSRMEFLTSWSWLWCGLTACLGPCAHKLHHFLKPWQLCPLNLLFFWLFQFRTWHLLPDRVRYSQSGLNPLEVTVVP